MPDTVYGFKNCQRPRWQKLELNSNLPDTVYQFSLAGKINMQRSLCKASCWKNQEKLKVKAKFKPKLIFIELSVFRIQCSYCLWLKINATSNTIVLLQYITQCLVRTVITCHETSSILAITILKLISILMFNKSHNRNIPHINVTQEE